MLKTVQTMAHRLARKLSSAHQCFEDARRVPHTSSHPGRQRPVSRHLVKQPSSVRKADESCSFVLVGWRSQLSMTTIPSLFFFMHPFSTTKGHKVKPVTLYYIFQPTWLQDNYALPTLDAKKYTPHLPSASKCIIYSNKYTPRNTIFNYAHRTAYRPLQDVIG